MTKPKHFHKAPIQTPEDPLARYEPYIKPVLWCLGLFLAALIGVTFWRYRAESRVANQWREFSTSYFDSANNGAADSLSQFSERFPATPAGLTAEQIAGDILLRSGLGKQIRDDAASIKDIEAAKERFKKIVDSSPIKTGLMYERAVYSLAYAQESLRNCDEASRWYGDLIKKPTSPFAELAQRGADRCTLAQRVGFFEALDSIEKEISEAAPDVGLPERPDITYPPTMDAADKKADSETAPPTEAKTNDPAPVPPADAKEPSGG